MRNEKLRTLVQDTPQLVGKEVLIKGWVKTRRDHGKLVFLDVTDKSGVVQVVAPGTDKNVSELRSQYVVGIKGTVHKRPEHLRNKKIPTGDVEIQPHADGIEIISKADTLPFDLDQSELNLELPTLLDFRSLTLRHPKQQAIFKVQEALVAGFRKGAEELGCTEIVVPTIAISATEGGAEVFAVDYYGHKAYLTQSPQLYKQMMVPIFERVWTIAHAYRAEPSVTTRHLSETTQLDCEMGFVTFEELLDSLEQVGVTMVDYTQEKCSDIFSAYNLERVALGKIPRLTLREAQEIIFKEFGRDSRKEKDLAPQDEVDICKWAKEKHKSDFVTITHFPTKAKPFYTMPDPKDRQYSLSYDLLFRGVEVLSGSQRINDYEMLVKSIKNRGMNPKDFALYLMAFKYGMPPEGGFSFGLERMTMKLFGLANIREASLFPRDMERIDERLSAHNKDNQKKR
ncbi:MAG: aspartate--tRNA(Asn) ligase [Candidatus Levybacteria bacterium]|nr:aspartate--tRNA(Asn) ligase [Candidatus Levybacteria bacterium]